MADIWNRTKAAWSAFRNPDGGEGNGLESLLKTYPENRRQRFKFLELYYQNVVYKELQKVVSELAGARPQDFTKIEALENPAVQAVDFHIMHLFPGDLEEALPVVVRGTRADPVKSATEQILEWSNMELRKRDLSEWAALYGQVFIKAQVSEDRKRSYIDIRKPEEVTVHRVDSRGNINYARLDIDLGVKPGSNKKEHEWWTEEWNKAENSYKVWIHTRGPDVKLEDLESELVESKPITSFGYDFVPLVKGDFAGGHGVFEKFIEAIDALNRQATKLRARYFRYNKPDHIIQRNEAGRGMVQTRVRETEDQRPGPNKAPEDPYESETENDNYINLPGQATYHHAVPDINYDAGLNQIVDTREAIERTLAELRFFRGHDSGDPSAAAMRQHIAPAVSRAKEARGNLENALVQSLQMCITIGVMAGLFQSAQVGTFEAGDFDITFQKREIIPETPAERSQRLREQTERFEMYQRLGILEWGMQQEGFSEEEAREIALTVQRAKEQAQAQALAQAQASAPVQGGSQINGDAGRVGRRRVADLISERGGQDT